MKTTFGVILFFLLCVPSFAQQQANWRYQSSSNCAGITGGKFADLCYQTSDQTLFKCVPSAGDCDTSAEWKRIGVDTANPHFTGNVGIGITAPTVALDVVGDGKFSGTVTSASSTVSGTRDRIGFTTYSMWIDGSQAGAHYLSFGDDGTSTPANITFKLSGTYPEIGSNKSRIVVNGDLQAGTIYYTTLDPSPWSSVTGNVSMGTYTMTAPVVYLSGGVPGALTDALYQNGDVLYWQGEPFMKSSGTTGSMVKFVSGHQIGDASSGTDYLAPAFLGLGSLADPNANNMVGWDDTDGGLKFVTVGTGLSYDHATHTLSSSVSVDQSIGTTSTPQFARLGLAQAADSSAVMMATGQYGTTAHTYSTTGNNPTVTINWNLGNVWVVTLGHTGTATITLSNGKAGFRYVLEFIQPGGGGLAVDYAISGVSYPSGTTPNQSTGPDAKDVIAMIYDGSEYLADASLNH